MIKDVRIRAFRATDDPLTCEKFVHGHKKVLEIYGIANITTNTNDWMYNPSIFVIVIEDMNCKLLGGARVQAADGINPLPVEKAIGSTDSKIFKFVRNNAIKGTGELSGLWNSKEVAGLGIGSYFSVQAGMAICEQIGISTLFSLCAPSTVKTAELMGGSLFKQVGNNGTFYYPKISLVATVMYFNDVVNFTTASQKEKEKILELKANLIQTKQEIFPLRNLRVNLHYNLNVAGANMEEFKRNYVTDFSDLIGQSKLIGTPFL